MNKIIRVDIDETICINSSDRDYTKAIPNKERINIINKLYDIGYMIIYWTSRGSTTKIDWNEFTKNQLISWGCKFHKICCDKPDYHLFICDKAVNSDVFFSEEFYETL